MFWHVFLLWFSYESSYAPTNYYTTPMPYALKALEYSIQTTWNDKQVDHNPVNITLEAFDDVSFKMSVKAPFFNDPPNPGGRVGQPFFGLWEFEGLLIQINCDLITFSLFTLHFQLLNCSCWTTKISTWK